MVVISWYISFLSLSIFYYLFVVKKAINLTSDYFFILIWSQIFIYIHIAPTLTMYNIDFMLKQYYLFIQIFSVLLFEIPLFIIYLKLKNKFIIFSKMSRMQIKVQPFKFIIFFTIGVLIIFFILNIFQDYPLWFKRIGHKGLANLYLSLPPSVWALFRTFEKLGVLILSINLITFFYLKNPFTKTLSFLYVLVFGSIITIYIMINSRLESAILVFVIFGVYFYQIRNRKNFTLINKMKKNHIKWLGILLIYLFTVVINSRTEYYRTKTVSLKSLNPISLINDDQKGTNQWLMRLNGIDLMAQITPHAFRRGFAHGEAWDNFFLFIYGPILFPEKVKKLKELRQTTAKGFLIKKYLKYDEDDYYSSILTDSYGNYGLLGFIFCAIIIAPLIFLASTFIKNPQKGSQLIIGIYIMINLLRFEHELGSLLSDLIKFSVILIPLLFINPIQVLRIRSY